MATDTDISPTTGQQYYSGSWEDIRNICRSLKIGDGKLSKITQELVNSFQEMVDREIDASLNNLYWTPIVAYNVKMPDGVTRSVFPGDLRRLARYWSAGLLLLAEFQGNEPNVSDSAQNYVEESKKQLYTMMRFNHRLEGQEMKSTLRTMYPTFQPPLPPEPV